MSEYPPEGFGLPVLMPNPHIECEKVLAQRDRKNAKLKRQLTNALKNNHDRNVSLDGYRKMRSVVKKASNWMNDEVEELIEAAKDYRNLRRGRGVPMSSCAAEKCLSRVFAAIAAFEERREKDATASGPPTAD